MPRNVVCFGFSLLCLVCAPATALSVPRSRAVAACGVAYETAQEERARGHLLAARQKLQACVRPACPEFMQADCGNWLSEIEAAQPSIVFAVRNRGEDVHDVRVLMDGRVLLDELDGTAVRLDPGMHTFVFWHEPSRTKIEKQLLILEGEKNRIFVVELSQVPREVVTPKRQAHETSAPARDRASGPNLLPYALLGVGALGIAGFATFGLAGNSEQAKLERICAPNCRSEDLRAMRTNWLLADVSLGIGLVSLGVGSYLFIKGAGTHDDDGNVRVTLRAGANGAYTTLASSF